MAGAFRGRRVTTAAARTLGPDDLAGFRALRLACLRLHPEAFGSSADEEECAPADLWDRRLASGEWVLLGGFLDGGLVGIAGLIPETKRKHAHIANFGAMYVAASARGKGVGDAIVAHALSEARARGIAIVTLTVIIGNEPARRLYERHGFVEFGRLHDSLRTGGRSYGEILMKCVLAPPPDQAAG